ncbi:HTH-type transcriptional regulator VirS [Roseivivax sp. THAF40]|uniref:AraC family transcriptional regulator n=1 Tax=unclassified Roseivivax TaxID=2639302 RepID=UPI001268B57E|nr:MULTISPECIES: AraC family transcriptional regulator [unclassified Roseivivax]QFS81581.1 HTH-type transcriptional regulator VirS [Roseivivax sp. THAF197b]QFT45310.1 HTH-type transcriptional regulator VirS [Roseivivax sp. THAF40]
MGVITALFARKVIDAAGPDVDRAALFARLGLAPDDPPGVKRMVPDADYYALLEEIAAALPDARDFPLRVGASMRCDDYGAFGMAWKTAPTLRGSLERAERYARLLTSVAEHEVRDDPRGAFFLLHRSGVRRLGLRLSNEATLASAMAIMREVSPEPVTPLEVHLQHATPGTANAHEAYFGCPIRFDADLDGILIGEADLSRSNRLGDAALARFLAPQLEEELAAVTRETSFEQVLLRRVSDHLSAGPPRAAAMAREMGVSERTLHRRLSEEGLSFQGILEKARRRLAEGLLVQSDHSIAEIAFLTGFAEQSSFTRAFKRWSERTPAAFRDHHRNR